jgi:hypothetical protein
VFLLFLTGEVNWLMNNVVNLNVNRVHDEPEWLTLQEASKITGLNTFTIRKRIKSGKLDGKKVNLKNKEVWYVSLGNGADLTKIDGERLNAKVRDEPSSERVHDELINELGKKSSSYQGSLIQEKDERITELVHHNRILERLLGDFQARMMNIESDKVELENKLKLLPAPPEMVANELQQKAQALAKAQTIIKQAQLTHEQYKSALAQLQQKLQEEEKVKADLLGQWELAQAELKRPWWKKLLGVR